MPIDLLALFAAFLGGLTGGLHCVAMCGGISAGFAAAAPPGVALRQSVETSLGRVAGYALAGALVGGLGGGLLQVARLESLQAGLRAGVGLVFIIAALRLLGWGGGRWLSSPARGLWSALRPLQRRVWPPDRSHKRVLLGMLWGWMPCGLSTTLLVAAWLEASALHGGLLMLAFGLGTLPVMIPLGWSGVRAAAWLSRPGLRRAAAGVLALLGVLTIAAPWLARVPALHAALEAMGCRSL